MPAFMHTSRGLLAFLQLRERKAEAHLYTLAARSCSKFLVNGFINFKSFADVTLADEDLRPIIAPVASESSSVVADKSDAQDRERW